MIETLETSQPITRFMEPGDTIRIEMIDDEGRSIFGAIDQTVTSARAHRYRGYRCYLQSRVDYTNRFQPTRSKNLESL